MKNSIVHGNIYFFLGVAIFQSIAEGVFEIGAKAVGHKSRELTVFATPTDNNLHIFLPLDTVNYSVVVMKNRNGSHQLNLTIATGSSNVSAMNFYSNLSYLYACIEFVKLYFLGVSTGSTFQAKPHKNRLR